MARRRTGSGSTVGRVMRLSIVIVGVGLLLAGCGSSAGEETTPPQTAATTTTVAPTATVSMTTRGSVGSRREPTMAPLRSTATSLQVVEPASIPMAATRLTRAGPRTRPLLRNSGPPAHVTEI